MTAYGKQTVIYNIHFKGEILRNGVRYLFPAFKRWQLVFPFSYHRLIKKLKPDVVLVHGLVFPWQIIMLRNIIGPHVRIICQHHAERPFRDLRKYIFRKADKYIAAGSRRPTDTAIATIEYRSKVKQERLPPIDAWLKQHGG